MRVRYVSTEEFTNDFINSLRDDRKVAFQRRYRDVDVLLVDDIQFLEGKEGTQEEFFHTFNTLHNANKQIVVSSDRPPKRLETLEDRMRTRFEWGLITDIQPPELETRIAILRKKAAQDRLAVPGDVLEFIAERIERNIRELEGALIRVTAFASLNRQPVDTQLAEIVLRDLIPDSSASEITAPTIMAVTSDFFGVTMDDLCGPGKTKALAQARQIAMYLCRELTDLSLPRIGQTFGGRDHTTVMHADKKIRNEIAAAPQDLRTGPGAHGADQAARPALTTRLDGVRRHRAASGRRSGPERALQPVERRGRTSRARRRVVHRPARRSVARTRSSTAPATRGRSPCPPRHSPHRPRPGDRHRPRSGDPACGPTCSGECPTTDRRPGHHPGVTDRSPSVVVRAHFTHIWGQLCGQLLPGRWMNGDGSVDNSWTVRGQLPGEPSCPPRDRPVHGPVPSSTHRTPRPATCPDDVHPHHPQALTITA